MSLPTRMVRDVRLRAPLLLLRCDVQVMTYPRTHTGSKLRLAEFAPLLWPQGLGDRATSLRTTLLPRAVSVDKVQSRSGEWRSSDAAPLRTNHLRKPPRSLRQYETGREAHMSTRM